jgi:hypothetical protein
MKNIKIQELPAGVLEKAQKIDNVFERLEKNREKYDSVCNNLLIVLTDKYKLSTKQWNNDIAPILRKFLSN